MKSMGAGSEQNSASKIFDSEADQKWLTTSTMKTPKWRHNVTDFRPKHKLL